MFSSCDWGKWRCITYIKNSNEYSYVTDVSSLIPSGYSVKGGGGFFSGVLLDLSNSDFNLIFEVDTDFESSLNLSPR